MAAKCEWAILCDYAFQDVGRKTCLIGAFDRVFAATVPVMHPHLAVVIRLVGEAHEKVQLRLAIRRPGGADLAGVSGEGQLSENGTAEIILNLNNLFLPDWGLYSVAVFIADDLSQAVSFFVTRPPEGSQPQPPR